MHQRILYQSVGNADDVTWSWNCSTFYRLVPRSTLQFSKELITCTMQRNLILAVFSICYALICIVISQSLQEYKWTHCSIKCTLETQKTHWKRDMLFEFSYDWIENMLQCYFFWVFHVISNKYRRESHISQFVCANSSTNYA